MKRLYHLLALLALVNLFSLAGLLGYLFASGKLNVERIDQIAMVLRGELPEPGSNSESVQTTQPAVEPETPQRSGDQLAKRRAKKEYFELLAERHQREMDDRRALNEDIRLQTVRIQEDIDQERKQFTAEKEEFLKESEQKGFTKTLEMLSKTTPKLARDILMNGNEFKEADVVQILMAMDENRVKKIINSCKQENQERWIRRILAQILSFNEESAKGVDGPADPSL